MTILNSTFAETASHNLGGSTHWYSSVQFGFLSIVNTESYHSWNRNIALTATNHILCVTFQFMDKNTEYVYSKQEVDDMYNVAVWPQLSKLAYEGTSAPTSLLILIETWSRYQR